MIIAGLYGTELNQTVSFDRPVKSVGIDPFFSKQGRGRQFVIGEEKVLLYNVNLHSALLWTTQFTYRGSVGTHTFHIDPTH